MIVKQAKVKQLKHGTSHITYAIGKLQGGMYWARDKSVWVYEHESESVSPYVPLCPPMSAYQHSRLALSALSLP